MRCLPLSAPLCLLGPAHSTHEVTETLAANHLPTKAALTTITPQLVCPNSLTPPVPLGVAPFLLLHTQQRKVEWKMEVVSLE